MGLRERGEGIKNIHRGNTSSSCVPELLGGIPPEHFRILLFYVFRRQKQNYNKRKTIQNDIKVVVNYNKKSSFHRAMYVLDGGKSAASVLRGLTGLSFSGAFCARAEVVRTLSVECGGNECH